MHLSQIEEYKATFQEEIEQIARQKEKELRSEFEKELNPLKRTNHELQTERQNLLRELEAMKESCLLQFFMGFLLSREN